ncbi:MAG TPA: formylglycine-generating enzyme family protein, partial [Kofleriaceae bacterium]|nr:formylglycine-generating enzyme family protein [Kofleriaceae bacterium]
LDEVRALGGLTAGERAFVEASRRRVRRQRLVRGVALAAVAAIVLAVVGVRLVAARARERAFAALAGAAASHEAEAARLAAASLEARRDAFRRFDGGDERGGEARWADARRLSAAASKHHASAAAQLEAAAQLDRSAAGARLAASLWAELELAEAEHDDGRVAALRSRLARVDPARAASLDRPGRIVLALDRPGRIAVHGFRCFEQGPDCVPGGGGPTIAGGFDAQPVLVRDGARLDAELPPGSYLAVLAMPDGHVVRAPFVIARGARIEASIAVPPLADAPPGFVHVPAGEFLHGSGHEEGVRRNLAAQPLRRVHGRAFWIARTEVTFGQWLAYLRELPPAERKERLPAGTGVGLGEGPDGRFVLSLEPAPGQTYRAAEGEPLVYPGREVRKEVRWERLPVSGVSYADALAYAGWLDRTGQVRGARVCTAREWEHAARGADGRSFPHGGALEPGHANIDATYGRVPSAFGPDEVGSFPASDSPYGVADLAGNVWEITTTGEDRPSYKGGSFYQTAFAATSENMGNPGDPNLGNIRVGLRICADAARAR